MLPKIELPYYNVEVPSNKKTVKMRPMVIKEEKILLMAKEANDSNEIVSSLAQVVGNCLQGDVKIENLTYFDLEYLFLKLRSMSVSNIVKATYMDEEDEKSYDVEIDLDKIDIKAADDINYNIAIGNIVIQLRYPPVSVYMKHNFDDMDDDKTFNIIFKASIEAMFDGDKAYDMKTVSDKEMDEFIDSIPSKHYTEIQEFFNKQPSLYYAVKYTNSLGNEKTVELTTLQDFFTF